MTQIEFESRVKMSVQTWEFEAINIVYNNCDLNKDDFCKMWVSMNKSRVQQYRKMQAEKEAAGKLLDKARKIYDKLTAAWVKNSATMSFEVLTRREGDILNEVTKKENYENAYAWDSAFEVGRYIKKMDEELYGIIA